jgi:HemY protein
MMRLVLFLLGVLLLAAGLSWLADRPGTLLITWQDYKISTSVFEAVVMFTVLLGLAILAWSIVRQIWSSPAAVSHFMTRRRQRRGLDALSSGMIAIGAGDRSMATRYAMQARKSLPNEPLTHLLRAQAAQLSGDKTTARRIFEAMLASPDTEQLGLRGLFLEAGREDEYEVQRQFAERALRLNPKLSWPVEALFALQCRAGSWAEALQTLAIARRNGHIDKPLADRRRAVLLTAQAQVLEDDNPDKALTLALEAHALAPALIPAAAIAGRLLAARGNVPRAAKVIQKTWAKSPHPELATAYAYARVGDSPRDRLDRIKQLVALNPRSPESPIALALAAVEARDYAEARRSLAPYLEDGLTRRMAVLMARIEAEDGGDKGRAREWIARAVNAPRDAAWIADGVVSERWAPISPVTSQLDAFEWRVPVEDIENGDLGVLGGGLQDLLVADEPVTVTDAGPILAPRADVVDAEEVVTAAATQKPAKTEARESQRTQPPRHEAETARKAQAKAQAPVFTQPARAPDDPGPDEDEFDDPSKVPGSLRVPG